MPRCSSSVTCPGCKEAQMERIERKPWMRRFAASKLYRCRNCGSRVLRFNNWFRLRLGSVPVTHHGGNGSKGPRTGAYDQVLRAITQLSPEELQILKNVIETLLREPEGREIRPERNDPRPGT